MKWCEWGMTLFQIPREKRPVFCYSFAQKNCLSKTKWSKIADLQFSWTLIISPNKSWLRSKDCALYIAICSFFRIKQKKRKRLSLQTGNTNLYLMIQIINFKILTSEMPREKGEKYPSLSTQEIKLRFYLFIFFLNRLCFVLVFDNHYFIFSGIFSEFFKETQTHLFSKPVI